jgi:NAD(P)-dependent dehydrogenase (short-subunit alcohol dehydrogenase family)
MALELAAEGVRVNAISPGPFSTDMLNNMPAQRRAEVAADIPLGRIADPAEIVGSVLYLSTEASSFMTGHVLVIDGGQTIGF